MLRACRLAALLLMGALASGCAALLPGYESEVRSAWKSYDEAREAIERIVPGTSGMADLKAIGIDPYASPNVQVLTFSDIALRFPVINLPAGEGDEGLRRCFEAGRACTGYAISVREVKRDRTGPFLQDALGFRRVTDVSGWSFNALVLVVDDRVAYTLYGGQPNLREQEVTRQPLGPLQGIGESMGNLVK